MKINIEIWGEILIRPNFSYFVSSEVSQEEPAEDTEDTKTENILTEHQDLWAIDAVLESATRGGSNGSELILIIILTTTWYLLYILEKLHLRTG